MPTFMPKAENISRKWYVLDAAGKPIGRVATVAASLLRGKHKPDFVTHLDFGDHVIILNAEKAVLTGNKLDQKYYRHHTAYIGGLKEIKYRTLMSKNPEKAIELAVKGMIPNTVIGRSALGRLRVYRGAEHIHAAQKPETWEL
ncbi:MAG TPA: 50S ribosomal protein L13 [Clostridia bacterium]|nr:50S ribosomal protein L13 [Clostridia bacterium]